MDDKTRIENTLKKIARFDFYINSTNTKASIIIAWNGIVIGTIFLKYHQVTSLYDLYIWSYYTANVFLVLIGVASVFSIVFVFDVIYPFLKEKDKQPKNEDNDTGSLFFFGSIARLSHKKYIEKEKKSSEKDVLEDVLEQSHILSKGLLGKMMKLQSSIISVKFQLFFIFIMVILKGVIFL